MSTENERIIELIAAQTRKLLQDHWPDIDSCRDGDEEIRIGFSHKLSYEGTERTVKSAISFAHRVKDQIEESIEIAQLEFPVGDAEKWASS